MESRQIVSQINKLIPIDCSSEELPLVIRFMFEKRMNVRHLIPEFLKFAKDTQDMDLFRYVISKCTPLDIRDFLRKYKISRTQKEIINKYLYSLDEGVLTYYYLKYTAMSFQEIFDVTHPSPAKWMVGEWFQKACYGQADIPESSMIKKLRDMRKSPDPKLLPELLQQKIPWHYLAQTYEPQNYMDVYIKYAHPRFIFARFGEIVQNPELINLAYEKIQQANFLFNIAATVQIVETYLTPADTAEKQRLRYSLLSLANRSLEKEFIDEQHVGKCAVIVDKSGSMEKSIELGVILAGIIATKTEADVYFFDHGVYRILSPKNIAEVLAYRKTWKANGGTNIIPVLQAILSQHYDTVVLVSDGFLNDWRHAVSLITEIPREQRWFYVEIPKVDNREVPWANRLFEHLQSPYMKLKIEYITDYSSVIAMLSYHGNTKIVAALQGIREDLIAWADTPVGERKMITYRKAVKCGNCGAPAPTEFSYCLWCGVPLEGESGR